MGISFESTAQNNTSYYGTINEHTDPARRMKMKNV
jgi:hypothetical protein